MKALTYLLSTLVLSAFSSHAIPTQLDGKLILPDYRKAASADKIDELKTLLAKSELQQFYELCRSGVASKELFKAFNKEETPVGKEKIANSLLALYGMILSAPVFERETTSQVSKWNDGMTRKIDLIVKRVTMININTLVVNMMSIDSKESLKVQETAVQYFAYALRFHKIIYDPSFTDEWAKKQVSDFEKVVQEEKKKKLNKMPIEEREKLMKETESAARFPMPAKEVALYTTNVNHLMSMNTMVRTTINFGEERLIELLIKVYPTKRAKAWELIMEAGYTKEEIPALLKRTVGRNPKTEFLFPDTKKK